VKVEIDEFKEKDVAEEIDEIFEKVETEEND